MNKIKKEALTLIIGSILFIIFDFIIEYYLFDGLTIFLWVSTIIFGCLFIIGFIIYKKIRLNIPYLPFNKNKNVRD
ncbi:hypothetical protein [Methanocaldococcus bathoardescens]|nr:hypothetical protein [Methanocaldococcus bathoardescens]